MSNKILLYFLIGTLVFSCQTVEKPQKPASFLPKEKMIAVLIDIAIVKSGKDYDLKSIKEKGITPSDFIYKKHAIDSTIFKESNAWYTANPKLYHELFTVVRDTLSARKERLEKQIKIKDSLKNVQDSIASLKKKSKTAPKLQKKTKNNKSIK